MTLLAKLVVPALLVLGSHNGYGQQAEAPTIPPDTEIRINMTTAMSSRLNKPGDTISGVVTSPEQFRGATVEGEIRTAKSSGKVNKTSVLDFVFQSVTFQGKTIPVAAQVKSVVNSNGKENVDEEGRVIEKKGNTGKFAAITGAGAVIGGLAGGAKGAAIGAGAGAIVSLVVINYGVKGPDIRFDPGTEFVVSVRERRESKF